MQPISVKEHFVFWISKVFHIGMFVVLPGILVGWGKTFLGYGIAASLVVGFILAIVFQLAHIVEDLDFVTPAEKCR
jgi:linoleoyl-CoA desaturase